MHTGIFPQAKIAAGGDRAWWRSVRRAICVERSAPMEWQDGREDAYAPLEGFLDELLVLEDVAQEEEQGKRLPDLPTSGHRRWPAGRTARRLRQAIVARCIPAGAFLLAGGYG